MIKQVSYTQGHLRGRLIWAMATFLILTRYALASESQPQVPKFSVKGDLRYRFEMINEEGSIERIRQRIRARLGISGKMSDDIDIYFQLATGGTDPVSTNETLDTGFSTKSLGVDQAYFDWHPQAIKGLNFFGGKMKNPWYMPGGSSLIWDGDLSPEGLAVTKNWSRDAGNIFLNLGMFQAEERSTAVDTTLTGLQLGFGKKIDKNEVTLGIGYFDWGNIEGRPTLYISDDGFGNSTITSGTNELYDFDFNQVEVCFEMKLSTAKVPISFFADYVQNTDPDNDNAGYLVGASIGKVKAAKDIAFKYNYRVLEADAVVGAFTDSDSWGGGTNGRGHLVGLEYGLPGKAILGITYLNNETAVTGGNEYHRVQVDLSFKF